MDIIKNVELINSSAFDFLASMFRLSCNEEFIKSDNSKEDKFKFNEEIISWIKATREIIPEDIKVKLKSFFDFESFYGICIDRFVIENNIKEAKSCIEKLIELSSNKLLYYFFSSGYNLENCSNEDGLKLVDRLIENEKEAIKFINNNTCIPSDKKWELLQFFLDPNKMKEDFLGLLSWYYENIYKDIEENINEKVKKYETELIRDVKRYKKDYLSFITNNGYAEEQKNFIAISYFLEGSMSRGNYENENMSYYIVGYRFKERYSSNENSILSLANTFKSIGDETRVNIIKLLSERPYYGKELAQTLSLSNSTISYHLSALVFNGFIRESKIENKIYYIFDKENMKRLICEAIDKFF